MRLNLFFHVEIVLFNPWKHLHKVCQDNREMWFQPLSKHNTDVEKMFSIIDCVLYF